MLKRLQRQPWVCARCHLKQQRTKRGLAGLAAAQLRDNDSLPVAHGHSGANHDDSILRKIFDSQPFWNTFSSSRKHAISGEKAGLLHNKYLTSPAGFQVFTSDALAKCDKIVKRVLEASTAEDYKGLVKQLDRLSDQLCRVIDLVDFIRNVHPDHRVVHGASQSHAQMFEYMNVLNTTQGLHDQLAIASSMPEVVASWSEEEKATARILLKDFAQSAITGPEENRQKFVDVSNDIVQLGSEILEDMTPAKPFLRMRSSRLKGMDPTEVKQITRVGSTVLPTQGRFSSHALKTVEDPDVRKELYMAHRTASESSVDKVEALVKKRAELAKLSDHESFAHMVLSDKMAKTPEAVNQFLEALATGNKESVNQDLVELLKIKQAETTGPDSNQINAWDRHFYTHRLRSKMYSNSRASEVLSSFFSLGTVMQGLSRLFNRLYGIRLVPNETPPGETWNDDVRRLDVIDENEGHIAVLYCDLFQRPNKSPNPAHFTLRCSREIFPSEVVEAAPELPPNPSLADLSSTLNDGMALNTSRSGQTLHQLPTVAFICDFPRPSDATRPTLLTFRQLSTLFHEMGHALHSILGRTALQNVAGTRCATDFAELPSILMEHFAASPDVLGLYARHWETDAPLNVDLVSAELAVNRRLLSTADTEGQILLSVLDQRYHSSEVAAPGWDSTEVYHEVFNDPRFASVPEPRGTAWQGFFGHLFGYGAVYYSYLFDRAIAARVWRDVFEGDTTSWRGKGEARALDREQGQRYRDEVLRWGGGRDGWRCVAGVLGQEKAWMSEGGEKAMEEVGRWGAGTEGEAGMPF